MKRGFSDALRQLLPALLLVGISFALFACAITDGHLQLDDWGYTAGCPFVAQGLSCANLAQAFRNLGHGGIWMPATYVTYMADVSIFGGGWAVHHATNVVLHALNAALVYAFLLALLRRLCPTNHDVLKFGRLDVWTFGVGLKTSKLPNFQTPKPHSNLPLTCLLAALLWAVHPLRAEAVVWIASRKEELWTFFSLLAALSWFRFLDHRTLRAYALACGLFVLACLAKPTAVCLPLVALALEWLLRPSNSQTSCQLPVACCQQPATNSRQPSPTSQTSQTLKTSKLPNFIPYVPPLFVSVLVGLIAIYSQSHPTGTPAVDVFGTTLLWRLANASVALGMYVGRSLVPCGIHIDYRAVLGAWPLDTTLGLSVLAMTVAAVVIGILRLRGTARRLLIFSAMAFLITLLPVLGIVGFTGDKAYADRYLYLPTVAILPFVALALAALADTWGRMRTALLALALGGVLAAVALPVIRSFRDDASAYGRVLSLDPDHWRALRIVGNLRCTQADGMDEGVAMLKRSLALRPSWITARSLAYVLAIRGAGNDFAEVKSLGRQVAAQPALDREGMMLEALGIVAMREGRDSDATRLFHAAVRAPERSHASGHALLNLGLSLANCGKNREAITVLRRVSATNGGNIRARAAKAIDEILCGQAARFAWSAE